MVPVNSIKIPQRFVKLSSEWYGSSSCMLYAITSTGNLKTGTIRPIHCETDEEWYLHLWEKLTATVWDLMLYTKANNHTDAKRMKAFHSYCEKTLDMLKESYAVIVQD